MKDSLFKLRIHAVMAVMLSLLCVAAASCSKDDSIAEDGSIQVNDDELNIMNMNGTELKLGDAAFYDNGAVGSGIDFRVAICSDEMKLHGSLGLVSGNGIMIYFKMFSSNRQELTSGTYNFSASGQQPGIFTAESYYMNKRDDNITMMSATGGRINVSSKGVIYTIQFECEYENGTKITGCYQGFPGYYQTK